MIPLKASEIAQIVGGKLVGQDVLVTAPPVINSVDATQGSFFLAVQGESRDGHEFADDAHAHGAVLTLASKSVNGTHIIVGDVIEALDDLEVLTRLNDHVRVLLQRLGLLLHLHLLLALLA